MRKRIKTALSRKLYYPRVDSELFEKIGIVGGLIFFILSLLCYLLRNNKYVDADLYTLFGAFCYGMWFIPVIYFLFKLWEGYALENDGIFFRHRFLKNKLLYRDIKYIIISNATGNNSRIVKTPYIIAIGQEAPDELPQCCTTRIRRHVLSSEDIRYELGAEIGCYHPGNFVKMFQKGSSVIYDYGFVWNKKEMHKRRISLKKVVKGN
jgi:hypothetical protein